MNFDFVLKTSVRFLFILIVTQIAFADQEGSLPSYTVETADKKHIFVMLTPFDAAHGFTEKNILFNRSGIYLNDGSTTPVWAVDWFANIYLPNGGEYVLRRGRWARYSNCYEEEAFSFVTRGEVIKVYRVKDLVDFPWLLPHSVSHYKWGDMSFKPGDESDAVIKVGGATYPNNTGVVFAHDAQTAELATFLGDRFKFDLATGNIISAKHPSRMIAIAIVTILLVGYLFYRFKTATRFRFSAILNVSNLAVGFVGTTLLLIVPVVSVWFTEVNQPYSDYTPTLFDRIWVAFYLFPAWCMQFFGIRLDEQYSLGFSENWVLLTAWIVWFSFMISFTLIDRCLVFIGSKLMRRAL